MDQNPEKIVSDRSLEIDEQEQRNRERMEQMPPEDRDSMDQTKASGQPSVFVDDALTDEEGRAAHDDTGGRRLPPASAQEMGH